MTVRRTLVTLAIACATWGFRPPHAAAQAPLLDAALTCGRPGEVGGPRRGGDLYRIGVDQTAFPDALCNDGTPAVFFVRRACPSMPEVANYWHIHLEGGGACNTAQSCANRWCSLDTNFGAAQMSSRGSPGRIRARGIFDRASRNAFHCWNQVFIHYCSSDSWSGEGEVDSVTADDPVDVEAGCTHGVDCTPVDYKIHFRGATIVDAVRNQLRRDCNGAACPPADFAVDQNNDGVLDWTMPDLDDATAVILSGSSAGSSGVRIHADAFGTALKATNTNCLAGQPCDNLCVLNACGLYYRAVIDAGLSATGEGEDFSTSCSAVDFCGDCTTTVPPSCTYQDFMEGAQTGSIEAQTTTRSEDSCEAWHLANDPAAETWRCNDPTHLALNHITTPYFDRQDRQDQLKMGNFVAAGFGTCQEFGDNVSALNLSLFDATCPLGCSAEEAGGAIPIVTPGVFVPEHQEHVGLTDRRAFFRVKVESPLGSGQRHTFHDTLVDWFFQTGAGQPQVVTEGSPVPPPYPATCP
jgi:Pectinacetylesterase